MDFCGGDWGAVGGGEFAIEIGGAKAAVRGVSMRVAEAVALGMRGQSTSASIGEAKLATVFVRFGAFRSHAGRVTVCVYSCLVTGGYVQFRTAVVSVRMRTYVGSSNQRSVIRKRVKKRKTQDPPLPKPTAQGWGTRLGFSKYLALRPT